MKSKKGTFFLTAVCAALVILTVTGCGGPAASSSGNGNVSLKIGVLRSEATSDEAVGRENYLEHLGKLMNFTCVYLTNDDDHADDVENIKYFAKQGCNAILAMTANDPRAILETCEQLGLYLAFSAHHPDFEDTDYSVTKDLSKIINDYSKYPHYVGSSGPSNYGEVLAGYQMGTAALKKGYKKFTIFSGSAAYGTAMHALRIAGLFIAMHEDDPSVSYAGIECSWDNWKRVTLAITQDFGINLKGFKSQIYQIVYSMGGYGFYMGDSQAVVDLIRLSIEPSDCVFCSGSTDAVVGFAGPASAGRHYVGNDSISDTFKQMFLSDTLVFDIAKYNSFNGTTLALLLKAVYDDKAPWVNGQPMSIEQQCLQVTGPDNYDILNSIESPDGGYFFSAELVSALIKGTTLSSNSSGYTRIGLQEWKEICESSATLDKGDLYDVTGALTKAYKAGNNTIVRFK